MKENMTKFGDRLDLGGKRNVVPPKVHMMNIY